VNGESKGELVATVNKAMGEKLGMTKCSTLNPRNVLAQILRSYTLTNNRFIKIFSSRAILRSLCVLPGDGAFHLCPSFLNSCELLGVIFAFVVTFRQTLSVFYGGKAPRNSILSFCP